MCLRYYEHELMELACQCPAVVCCRCSPTQKARIVTLLQTHTRRRTCAIGECRAPGSRPDPAQQADLGRVRAPHPRPSPRCLSTPGDGGNDVSMIQAADCGIGIEGKVRVSWRRGCARVSAGPAGADGVGALAVLPAPRHTLRLLTRLAPGPRCCRVPGQC